MKVSKENLRKNTIYGIIEVEQVQNTRKEDFVMNIWRRIDDRLKIGIVVLLPILSLWFGIGYAFNLVSDMSISVADKVGYIALITVGTVYGFKKLMEPEIVLVRKG